MTLSALLLLCGMVCLGQGARTPAHNVRRRSSSPTEDITVRLQLEADAAEPWSLSVGDTVQITCSLSSDSDMERAKKLNLHLNKIEEEAIQELATAPASTGISYTLSPVTLRHRGLYNCEADKTDPHITVKEAYKLIWVNDTSAAVSLELLRVDRVKYFYDKTLTIGCRLPNDQSEWRIMSASEKTGSLSPCPNQKRSGDLLSCTILSYLSPTRKFRQHFVFWCESSAEHKSNILNGTTVEFSERDGRDFYVNKFDVTPAWFVREGDSVVIECKVNVDHKNVSGKFDLQLVWTKMGLENNMTVLLSQQAIKPINYTLNNITHEHSGVYSCWDDGLAHVFTIPWHHFIWVQDDSPSVIIDVLSHNRTQFLHNEEMTVGCQLPTDQSQWKLKSFDKWTGIIKECEKSELSPSRLLSCTMNMGAPWTDFLFWCESTTGLKSNVLNVTNTVGNDVLEAPTLPVMEGDDFTLRCLLKDKTTGKITPSRATFWRKFRYIGASDVGSITLKNVTKENEGLYHCNLINEVATLDTYVTVKARPQEKKKTN